MQELCMFHVGNITAIFLKYSAKYTVYVGM